MLSEAMIRHVVGRDGAQALIDVIEGAWGDHIAENRFRLHRSTRAHIVWDYMAQRAMEAFEGAEGVTCIMRSGRPNLVFRDLFTMRPKMHDREANTRNYPTARQMALANTGILNDMPLPHATFGYILDAAEAGVGQCLIRSAVDDDEWVIDLYDLAAGNIAPVQGMFDVPELDATWQRVEPIRLRRAR